MSRRPVVYSISQEDSFMVADPAPSHSGVEVRRAAASFARPIGGRGAWQLLTSFGPFIAACAAMYLVCPVSPLLTLALAVPTGLLLLRVFVVQHDCGHGSFFASRRANTLVGRACSLLTLTPFAHWARQHNLHHGNWSNLDRRDSTDLYSACLTVREYRALSPGRRFLHRAPRHPLIVNVLLPPLLFLLVYRVPFDTPRHWARERRSVYFTDAALFAMFAVLAATLGWQRVLLVHLPVVVVGATVGAWLFSLQHRFESAHWSRRQGWNAEQAALDGSSWFDLPRILHWLTGNIGYHHIHHLDPRVPSYRLRGAHEAVQAVRPVRPLGLAGGLRAPWLTLWDETHGRLVSFRDAARGIA
jgi:omega-6 fatty acid desaturase (delta-12 desaturase)